ncbi:hypothetical protein ACU4GD_27460 [Cupriavidus basilensis]
MSGALDSDKGGFTYRSMGDGLKAFDKADGATIVEAEYTRAVSGAADDGADPLHTAQVTGGRRAALGAHAGGHAGATGGRAPQGVGGDQVRIDIRSSAAASGDGWNRDFIGQAVADLCQTEGRPVQIIWAREEDVRHDFYRPQAIARLQARVENGKVTAIASRSAGPSRSWRGEPERLFGARSAGIDRYAPPKACSICRTRSSTSTLRTWRSVCRFPWGSGAASASRTPGSSWRGFPERCGGGRPKATRSALRRDLLRAHRA